MLQARGLEEVRTECYSRKCKKMKLNAKAFFTLEQTVKDRTQSRSIALLFL
jgi:hypothetical protein